MTKVTHLTLEERSALNRKRIHLREISGEADTPLETVGQDLRAARLRRGDDLATVSRALKIRKDHLEALEEDRFEALPGRTYAVGFVRSYAGYLGLDPLQSLERFKEEIAGRAETQPTIGPPPDNDSIRLPQGWLIIGVVVVGLVLFGAYHLVRSADELWRQQVGPVPARIVPPPPPSAVTSAAIPRHMASAAAPAATSATSPAASPAPASTPENAQPTAQSPVSGSPSAAPLPTGHAYGLQNHNARVVLKARAAAHMLIQGSNGTIFLNRVLQPGDSYNVPNKVGLTLTTPDGGAIAVVLDGQPMGNVASGAGVTEALPLDPQAVADRYNRTNPG